MFFHGVITFVVSVAFLAQGVLAAPSALTVRQIVVNINLVATMSGDANVALSKITQKSPPSQLQASATTLANNFGTIIKSLQEDVTAMQATPPFSKGVSTQPIVDALNNFVLVHQALLATVIGKHGIFAQFLLTAPIATVLSNLEAIIDAFAFALIRLIPSDKSSVTNDQLRLDVSVKSSISLYSKICIPSLLYPTIQPVCFAV